MADVTIDERVETLASEVERERTAVETARRELADARREIARLEDRLGTDAQGRPLPIGPLAGTIVATTAALTSAVLAYVMALMTLPTFRPRGPDSDSPDVAIGLIAAALVGVVGLWLGRRPGAGGSARALLRPLAKVLLALSLVAGLGLLVFAIAWARP